MRYHFDICYLERRPQGYDVFAHHEEFKDCANDGVAHGHFLALLGKFKVDGSSYYLCHWSESTPERPRLENVIAN